MGTPEIGKRLKTIAAICLGVNSRMFQLDAKVGLNSGFRKGQGRPPWATLGKQAMKLKPAACPVLSMGHPGPQLSCCIWH